jgi:hypothetical protein
VVGLKAASVAPLRTLQDGQTVEVEARNARLNEII